MDQDEILFPDQQIIDTHMHLWNLHGQHYLAPEFLADAASGHNVTASIYVECDMNYGTSGPEELRSVEETRAVHDQIRLAQGSGHRLAAGIVGSLDLSQGAAARAIVEAHVEASAGRFRGIRARIAWDADPVAGYHGRPDFPQRDLTDDPAMLEVAQTLEEMGLTLDSWGFHPQGKALAGIARACPDLTVVVNHFGGPLRVGRYAAAADEARRDWIAGLRALAEMPNVFVKLSGIGVTRLGLDFGAGGTTSTQRIAAVAQDHVDTCIDIFSPDRCIFGSNYPVDHVVSSYPVLLNAYKRMLGGLSKSERDAIFWRNACRAYRLTLT